jgi:hypothetical protein
MASARLIDWRAYMFINHAAKKPKESQNKSYIDLIIK